MENNSQNKKKIIISVICIMILILFSVGIVYAFFNYSRTGQRNNVLNTANLTFSFEDSEWIWLENAYPMTQEKALTLETTGNDDQTEVDGGIAQFKVTGGHNSGAIHYQISLIKEDLTQVTTSKNGTYSLDPSTKIGQLPDGAVSINLQTSTNDIFETTGLVNDTSNLNKVGKSFTPSYTGSYINTSDSVSIDKLPQGDTNERILGTGIMSGDVSTRYFELRMWINDTVLMNDELSTACLSSTSSQDITAHGRGYCNPSTSNLPTGIKYVYSSGEFAKLYYSNKIKVETTDVSAGVIKPETPPITETLLANKTLVGAIEINNTLDDSGFSFGNISGSSDSGLIKMKSTENDDYPIYYYRGAVNNNNVIFGGFCWKIVRTTETGGTKIIYDGVPSSGQCNNTGENTHIKTSAFNSSNNSPAYVGYKYGSTHPSRSAKSASNLSSMGNIVYGKNITYANGTYTLVDTISKDGANYSTDRTDTSTSGMQYHHYTCLSSSSTCSTVYYVHYLSSSMYYFSLTGGQTHLDLLNEMLINDGSVNSTVYNELNAWYTANLLSYASKLEDTVFCNDRSIADYGGWDINNANTSNLCFGAYGRLRTNTTPSLVCQNSGDRFTVNSSNGNGLLEYPIGLLTADEYALAGAVYNTSNSSFYLYNGQYQWSLSPSLFYSASSDNTSGFYLGSSGYLSGVSVGNAYGLRPVVSLAPGATITGGNGSSSTPYLVGN